MRDPLQDIMEERARQDEHWGEQNHEPERWLALLGEEFGDACKGALFAAFKQPESFIDESGRSCVYHSPDIWESYRREMVHVAAVALAALECLERGKAGRRQ